MWEIEQLKIKKKMFAKIKNKNFKFEDPHRKIFNINWDFLANISASYYKHFTI